VTGTKDHAVAHGGRYERILGGVIAVLERQPMHAVVFETIHELVSHHAVCAKRLLTIVTVGHHVGVKVLTALAHAGELVRVDLDRTVDGEVRQQSGYTAVGEDALLMAIWARDLLRLILVVL